MPESIKERQVKIGRQLVADTARLLTVIALGKAGGAQPLTPDLVRDFTRKSILAAEKIHQELTMFVETGVISADD